MSTSGARSDDRVWCGIDIGTTSVKALLVGAAGQVLARASRPTPRVPDAFGACTDADQIFELVEELILLAWREAGLSAPLLGLCVGGVGEDGVLLDAALRPLQLSIPWNDRRAAVQADRLSASPLWRGAGSPVMELTRTAAKWAWLRDNCSAALRETAVWVALTDYPAMRWTTRPFMSRTLASRTACYDPVARAWLPELLDACGAPPLPAVLSGGEIVGAARSERLQAHGVISERTTVVAGGHDHPMGAFLVSGTAPGAILDSMGTAELVYVESDQGAAGAGARPGHGFHVSASILDGRTAWLAVLELSRMLEPMQAAAHPLHTLFASVMTGGPIPGAPGAGGLRFGPDDDGTAFVPRGPLAQRLRAVLEGGALATRRLIAHADRLGGAPEPGPVFVAGGWARSDSLLQLRADIIGRPLRRVGEPQLSALGCAHLAAHGTGTALPVNLSTHLFAPDAAGMRFYEQTFEDVPA